MALSTKSGITAICRDGVASEGGPASIQDVQGHGSGTAAFSLKSPQQATCN
ncbi:MAG TPA: hypothetical protein VGI40_28620 [Pirellulaceae bacterium]